MKPLLLALGMIALLVSGCGGVTAQATIAAPTSTSTAATSHVLPTPHPAAVEQYDPARDPAKDIQRAVVEAQKSGKRILLEVGGEWCKWCHIMDAFFEKHPELLKLREEKYILVKINYSTENENEAFLSQYPPIAGYPHIFILENDGKLLHSQNTAELEEGPSYNLDRFMAFLTKWAKS